MSAPGTTQDSRRGGWRQDVTTAAILLALAAIGLATNQPVLLAPFAASAVSIAMTPQAAGAAPRTVLLAYLIAMAAGVIVLVPEWDAVEGHWLAATAATVLALRVMRLSKAVHLPATAMPVLIGASSAPALTMMVPVALGTVVLVALSGVARRLASPN
jgi:CBS-domain-containing membrane protein